MAHSPRHVLEPAVAAIVQQLVLSHAGDEEIDVTVVVVVGRGGPHGIPDTSYACVVGDVRKPHPAVVAIETVGVNGGCFLERRRLRAVREEDVGPAVTVVVEDGKPAGRTFDEVFAGTGGVMVDELQTGRGGDLAQVHGPWRRRRLDCEPCRSGRARRHRDHRGHKSRPEQAITTTHDGDLPGSSPATTINAELAEPAEKTGSVLRVLRFLR